MSIAHSPPENTAIFNAVNESAIGIDVHADLYVAVYQQCSFGAKNVVGHRKFTKGATKADIDELARWCVNLHPQVILMESTGVYWQALYEGLERAGFNQSNIAVVNARDVKNKKGSKTDLSDAQHLAEVARRGDFTPSFVPEKAIRQLRCLFRSCCSLKKGKKRALNILHKQLTQVGCRASSVFSDIKGKIATKILEVLIAGISGSELLAAIIDIMENSRGRLKATPQKVYEALTADMDSMVWFSIRKHLDHIKFLDQQIAESEENLRQELQPYWHFVELLMTIPGIKENTAMGVICELGCDLSAFKSVRKFCKWIGLAPGNNESAGKRYSNKITHGNKYLRTLLVEVASGIGLMKQGFLHEVHQRFKERRGTKRANVAIANKLARIIYSIMKSGQPYEEQYKPVLKDHRLDRAVKAIDGLRTAGFTCDDIKVTDIDNGHSTVIFGANKKRKRRKSPSN